ncbi:alanyl-tRNA synthetase [Heterostelium album PN500]|uniref:Alanine--tRNA ligase n=1 Tax=Heterostelium pallidum (strain ATCC 26659 / Pp 5 / PN500) TaxID=670386 RepID=D3B7Q7_HETP5|nr:alanyl-tRNA synthetase [Heterostelium album PN500]EFA82800.1 alanyl-tRNA synthetase [Heterostelium album PN500]|eukprot:XP_020434917.1 alanyl-tRNA synthetase [Heterostelium album PN500]
MTSSVPTVNEIRKTFIDFFVNKCEHTFVPSSQVVPHDDPTLLFANAGMNQFKPIFLGQADPRSEQAKLKRAANSQKCIRAGGKHNDLDDVGKDTYHHTFFEMLGNWSFGNYFKREAITWAWELLTDVYKLDKERLYASYFGGAADKGLEPDLEAKSIWEEFLPADRVLPFGMKENFWEMGDTGPCGPCSEIHFDKIEGRTGSQALVNADDPTLIEIWNLVFIQYNREADKSLRPLPNKHVDTGMGLERVTSIIQKVGTNYDTDIFGPIFTEIQKVTGFTEPYGGKVGKDDPEQVDMAYRVIADHIRTLTFSLADGAIPSSDGRGSVLRRILRRAIRYGKQKLKAPPGFFHRLVDVVVAHFGEFFPELRSRPQHIISVIESEEKMFERTLDKGILEFENILKKTSNGVISASHAHYLSSSFGFPIDLTTLMAEEKGVKVDLKGYEVLVEKFAEDSRRRQKEKKSELNLGAEPISILQKRSIQPTNDQYKYEQKEVQTVVKAIWTGKELIDQLTAEHKNTLVGVILESTNFYPEQGGQIYDIGNINFVDSQNTAFTVSDCKVFGGYVLHIGYISDDCDKLAVGDKVETTVDYTRRIPIMSNHTSTHMVNFALRQVLGSTVDQRGSLVDNTRLRFDFSSTKGMSKDELVKTDAIVNELIAKQLNVYCKDVELASAKKIYGLRAVFGEVYPDPVRVVSVGVDVNDLLANPSNTEWANYSIEFCGGTHIANSKEAELFTIVSEEAVSAGVRRLFAVTGTDASVVYDNNRKLETAFTDAAKLTGKDLKDHVPSLLALLESHPVSASKRIELLEKLNNLQTTVKKYFKELESSSISDSNKVVDEIIAQLTESKAPVHVGVINLGLNNSAITDAIKNVQKKCPDTAIMFVSPDQEKKKVCVLSIVPPTSTAASKGLTANGWVVKVAEQLGGKGGGKTDVAQGTGSQIENVDNAVEFAKDFAKKLSL